MVWQNCGEPAVFPGSFGADIAHGLVCSAEHDSYLHLRLSCTTWVLFIPALSPWMIDLVFTTTNHQPTNLSQCLTNNTSLLSYIQLACPQSIR